MQQLTGLDAAFLASAWAVRQPVEVEVPFETPLGPLTLRGRIDAVFARPDGGFEVIDWKTGPPPSGRELTAAGVQLAAYRLGWSRLTGVPVERVSAGFHHVAAGVTLRPVDGTPTITKIELVTRGRVPGVGEAEFRDFAASAKANCPERRCWRFAKCWKTARRCRLRR